jgi:hypothetical protein
MTLASADWPSVTWVPCTACAADPGVSPCGGRTETEAWGRVFTALAAKPAPVDEIRVMDWTIPSVLS